MTSESTNRLLLAIGIVSCASSARADGCGASFTRLGDLNGGSFDSHSRAVSADGSVVVGLSHSSLGIEAFRWENGVMMGLNDLPYGSFHSEAYGVSADGAVVVGRGRSPTAEDTGSDREAFRWENGLMAALGDLGDDLLLSEAYAITPDGTVIVGRGYLGGNKAVQWEDSLISPLEASPDDSVAYGVSAGGSIICGFRGPWQGGHEAVRWVDGAMQALGDLPGGEFESFAYDCSLSGAVIVGYGTSVNGQEACRWFDGAVVGLGDLPGGTFDSWAFATSGDGAIVVGYGHTEAAQEAFIWTAAGGLQKLRDVLVAGGVTNLTGWTLTLAHDISDDGTTVVGEGLNPSGQIEAWAARLPALVTSANPPVENPFAAGFQPFRDVLDTGGGPVLTEGIGSEETSSECGVVYAPIEVTFNTAPTIAPNEPGGVAISCTGGSSYPCPCVASVTGTGAGPYQIHLDDCGAGIGVLPPGQCTTITFAGAPGQKLQYQSLPGDVNMNGAVSSSDVLALVTAINNGQAALCQNLPRYDLNRSGAVSAADVLREVQLLNGLNSPQAFLGATVAPCP